MRHCARACIVTAILLATGLFTSTSAQDGQVGPEDLLDAAVQARPQVVRQMVAQHEALIAGLTELMDEPEDWQRNWDAARAAAFLLGELRATQAVPVLARFVDFGHRDPVAHLSEGPAWADYLWRMPAVRALVQIGEPCLDAVVQRIGDDDPGATGWLPAYCVRVLVGLRGVEGAGDMLVRAIMAETDPGRRERLTSALQLLLEHAADYEQSSKDPLNRRSPYAVVP